VVHVNSYLGSAFEWHEAQCQPIVAALFAGDEAQARAALAVCWKQLPLADGLSADARRSLEYTLLEYELSIANRFHEDDAVGVQFRVTYPAIRDLPPAGPESDIVQAKTIVGLIGMGTRRGFIKASEAELDTLMSRIPEEFQTPNIWYYVVAWAFFNNSLKYLELAMERQTLETTGWLDDYYWMRTNLMYLLVSGRASRLDVEKTIKGYRHPLHISDFHSLFLARCEAAGLMDEELLALLEQREAELHALEGTTPPATPRTARVVKQD
jgi:hypothetical protein